MKKSVEFYRAFCGLEVVREHGEGPNDHAVWMTEPDRQSDYVFVLLLGGKGNIQSAGDLTHFGFALNSEAEVDEMARRGRSAFQLYRSKTSRRSPPQWIAILLVGLYLSKNR